MPIRIPLNLIVESKYTYGGEYIIKKTYEDYKGYYYEFNSKTFAGRDFSPEALLLIRRDSEDINFLLVNSNSQVNAYGKLINRDFNFINKVLKPQIFKATESGVKFFAKKVNQTPVKIIHISEETYEANKNNPLYVFTSLEYSAEFGPFFTPENTKPIPEIKEYLSSYSSQDSID
jgi:hypothetical protein